MSDTAVSSTTLVKHFRQILLWPLQLISSSRDTRIHKHWQWLEQADSPWAELDDEFVNRAYAAALP